MATTYTWIIDSLDRYPNTESGQSDVVFNVRCRFVGTNGTNTAFISREISIPHNSDDTFTPYADLTAEIVTEWIVNSLSEDGIIEMQESINTQLAIMPVTAQTPPWATTPG
jgi:hypothetical protein